MKAFDILSHEIDNDLFEQGNVLSLAHVFARLIAFGRKPTFYRADKLHKRLMSHYGDNIVIQPRGRSKSNLIFSSSITVGHAVAEATVLKESVITFDSTEENDTRRK